MQKPGELKKPLQVTLRKDKITPLTCECGKVFYPDANGVFTFPASCATHSYSYPYTPCASGIDYEQHPPLFGTCHLPHDFQNGVCAKCGAHLAEYLPKAAQ